MRGRGAAALLLGLGLLAAPTRAQEPPAFDPTEIINSLLASLLGFRELTAPELQQEVAEVGGVPFRSPVSLDFLSRSGLRTYVQEVLDEEYPPERALSDQRTLVAFDLLAPSTDLRALRARLLEENVVGFYDERPGRRRLYAVSAERSLTPANQLVLAHELRHALQDQYVELHKALPARVGDFDDRRLALLSLLEGDATLVMERFLLRRLPGGPEVGGQLAALSLPAVALPGSPPVLQDQMVLPYLAGRDFAQAIWRRGGWEAVREAWSRPPQSTEQVLHPEKYFSGERPRAVEPPCAPEAGRPLNEGVLGEMLTGTLLGEGAEAAADGWGGDLFRAWDAGGKTLLVWSSQWDTLPDARQFREAARARFRSRHGEPRDVDGFEVFASGPWRFAWGGDGAGALLVSADDPGLLEKALRRCRARPERGSP